MADGSAQRHNRGKTRHDLTPAFAQEQYARVLTIGAEKYGDNNWRKGMPWTSVIASAERHLLALKSGEDYDAESGLLHSAHLMANMAILTEFYKIYPQGDNRAHSYMVRQKIGVDIDELMDGAVHTKLQPHCYFSSKAVHTAIKKWLCDNGLPDGPIFETEPAAIRNSGVDMIVTADFANFIKLSKGGVCCYLLFSDKNKKHNVGHKRLDSLDDLA
jgi:hypothetical protein